MYCNESYGGAIGVHRVPVNARVPVNVSKVALRIRAPRDFSWDGVIAGLRSPGYGDIRLRPAVSRDYIEFALPLAVITVQDGVARVPLEITYSESQTANLGLFPYVYYEHPGDTIEATDRRRPQRCVLF